MGFYLVKSWHKEALKKYEEDKKYYLRLQIVCGSKICIRGLLRGCKFLVSAYLCTCALYRMFRFPINYNSVTSDIKVAAIKDLR